MCLICHLDNILIVLPECKETLRDGNGVPLAGYAVAVWPCDAVRDWALSGADSPSRRNSLAQTGLWLWQGHPDPGCATSVIAKSGGVTGSSWPTTRCSQQGCSGASYPQLFLLTSLLTPSLIISCQPFTAKYPQPTIEHKSYNLNTQRLSNILLLICSLLDFSSLPKYILSLSLTKILTITILQCSESGLLFYFYWPSF